MPQINLLPWREELRRRRQKRFGLSAVIAVVLMLVVVGGVHLHFQRLIEHQQARNEFLNKQIKQLDKRIEEIRDLKKQRQRLLARTDKIQQLQSGRPDVVHMVDELVKTLPDGVYLTKVSQRGARLALEGVAQSNARVSSLMRQLNGSDWLHDPRLLQIAAAGKAKGKAKQSAFRNSTFKLNIKQTKKTAAEDTAAKATGKKSKKKNAGKGKKS